MCIFVSDAVFTRESFYIIWELKQVHWFDRKRASSSQEKPNSDIVEFNFIGGKWLELNFFKYVLDREELPYRQQKLACSEGQGIGHRYSTSNARLWTPLALSRRTIFPDPEKMMCTGCVCVWMSNSSLTHPYSHPRNK